MKDDMKQMLASEVQRTMKIIPQHSHPEDMALTQKMQLKIYYDLKSALQAALRKKILTFYSELVEL